MAQRPYRGPWSTDAGDMPTPYYHSSMNAEQHPHPPPHRITSPRREEALHRGHSPQYQHPTHRIVDDDDGLRDSSRGAPSDGHHHDGGRRHLGVLDHRHSPTYLRYGSRSPTDEPRHVRSPRDRFDRKGTFVVSKINGGSNGAEEIFPVVESGYRPKLKREEATAADEALIRRVLRKADRSEYDRSDASEVEEAIRQQGGSQYRAGRSGHADAARQRNNYHPHSQHRSHVVESGSDTDNDSGSESSTYESPHHHERSGRGPSYDLPRRRATPPVSHGGSPAAEHNRASPHRAAYFHQEQEPQHQPQFRSSPDRSAPWRQIQTPSRELSHNTPLHNGCATTTATTDVAVNTSFHSPRSASVPKSAVGVMTSPGLRPALPAVVHAATSPAPVSHLSPLPGHLLAPTSGEHTFGVEISSVRSSSAQSVTPLRPPQTTGPHVIGAVAQQGAEHASARRTTLPPAGGAQLTLHHPPTHEVMSSSPLDADVTLASSTTSIILSPRRRSSSPTAATFEQSGSKRPSGGMASPHSNAAAAADVYEVGGSSRRAAGRTTTSHTQQPTQQSLPSPVFVDTPLEEYVVPATRNSKVASSGAQHTNAADEASPTKDILRSYSHRSLFRPAREDIDAVRRISSTLTRSTATAAPGSSPSKLSGQMVNTTVTSASSWC